MLKYLTISVLKFQKYHSLPRKSFILNKNDLFVLGNRNQEENQLMTATNALGQGHIVSSRFSSQMTTILKW